MKSLLNKTLTQFIVCTIIILLLATPLFYLLTKHYYAEDMIDIMAKATQQNQPIPELDLEQDIMQGVMIRIRLNQRGIRHCHHTHDPFRTFQTFMETFRRYAKTT